MTGVRIGVRSRLTLLFASMFALSGIVVVAVTYVLVSNSLAVAQVKGYIPSDTFLSACAAAAKNGVADPNLRAKCAASFQTGVRAGASAQQEQILSNLLIISIFVVAVVTILSAIIGWIVAGRVLRPIKQITLAAQNASSNNLSARLSLAGPRDELRELADTFDGMLDRLEMAFSSQQHFVANASHELRTPLTVMRTSVEVALAKPEITQLDLSRMGAEVRSAADHAEALIESLLLLARNDPSVLVMEQTDLATIAENVIDSSDFGALSVRKSLGKAPAFGDSVLLERAVFNLVDNAIRYNKPAGKLAIVTSASERGVSVSVTNTGQLVPTDSVGLMFEPFRRMNERSAVRGYGLGLTLVRSIVAMHSGEIEVVSHARGGLSVTINLPVTGLE